MPGLWGGRDRWVERKGGSCKKGAVPFSSQVVISSHKEGSMKKRWFVWFTMFAALSLVAAACAGDEKGPTPKGGGDADPCADDEFGCVEVAEGDPISIGTL